MQATVETFLLAYTCGAFPMADSRTSSQWAFYQPIERGIFQLDQVCVPNRLRRWLKNRPFDLIVDQDFDQVISHCATATRSPGDDTWINQDIERVFCELHDQGLAHCISAYDDTGKLVGGLYGLHLGGAFFGESMFSLAANASKTCLVALFSGLQAQGFDLIDAQMPNDHLTQFGLQTWPNERFLDLLPALLVQSRSFPSAIPWEQIEAYLAQL